MSINYVSIPFKSGYYMCVEGSQRAETLHRANRAWVMGYDALANDLLATAMLQPGCAFDHRENLNIPCDEAVATALLNMNNSCETIKK